MFEPQLCIIHISTQVLYTSGSRQYFLKCTFLRHCLTIANGPFPSDISSCFFIITFNYPSFYRRPSLSLMIPYLLYAGNPQHAPQMVSSIFLTGPCSFLLDPPEARTKSGRLDSLAALDTLLNISPIRKTPLQ